MTRHDLNYRPEHQLSCPIHVIPMTFVMIYDDDNVESWYCTEFKTNKHFFNGKPISKEEESKILNEAILSRVTPCKLTTLPMSSEQLKKEIFLLEHSFYDESIVEFVNKNLKLFFSEKSILFLSGVKLEINADDHRIMMPAFNNYAAPTDILGGIMDESHCLIHRARKTWFKQKYPDEFKGE